jgi:hypothetical protein
MPAKAVFRCAAGLRGRKDINNNRTPFMKLDFETLIYIVVIIIWLVVSYLRKNKQKEQPPARKRPSTTMPPVGESPMEDFSTILEEILGERKKPKEVKKASEKQPKQPAPKPRIKLEKRPMIPPMIGDSTERSIKQALKPGATLRRPETERKKKEEIILEETQAPLLDRQSLLDPSEFDLQKAVIYSEILNAPYK